MQAAVTIPPCNWESATPVPLAPHPEASPISRCPCAKGVPLFPFSNFSD
jgi:hypothetical protein